MLNDGGMNVSLCAYVHLILELKYVCCSWVTSNPCLQKGLPFSFGILNVMSRKSACQEPFLVVIFVLTCLSAHWIHSRRDKKTLAICLTRTRIVNWIYKKWCQHSSIIMLFEYSLSYFCNNNKFCDLKTKKKVSCHW